MASEQKLLRCLTTALTITAVGCVAPGEPVGEATAALYAGGDDAGEDAPDVILDQGWDPATRAAFYQTTQGSRMLPYSWFLHLENADRRQLFRAASNMRRMGFLVDGATEANPDNLPVGFARDVDSVNGDQIGLTCAGCHTGEIEYAGTRIRIDGSQGMGDLEQLQNGILASLQATLADARKFDRFARAIGATDRAALRTEMEAETTWWERRIQRTRGLTPHGPSRTDAFSVIGNEVVCELLGVPENCAPGIAPTQFPHLWGTPDFEWAQYNSSVHSPLGRNVGEVTGVFAEARLDASGRVVSSANIPNLHALENWVRELESPLWPEDILGEIDLELAAEGEVLYAENCVGCHAEVAPRSAPNVFGRTFAQMDFSTPLGSLGTDPMAAMTFATRRAYPGPWLPMMSAVGITVGPDGKVPAVQLLALSGSMIIQRFFAVSGFTPPQIYDYLSYRESRSAPIPQLITYRARPLDGIAFTAPFLHNGSVPSMYELLLPPAQRSTEFYVGSNEFDPVDLGFSTEPERGAVLLSTTALGNGNGGHVYGTDLSDHQRYALIEYLKTL
ncbi:MAG: cytochrome c [Myxococcota bacterium]|nr:cytochrome c [Myxococcota bacterium]